MSKSKSPASTTAGEKLKGAMAQAALSAKQLVEKGAKMRGVKALGAVLLGIIFWHLAQAGSAMTAMLYIWANNGKMSGRADGNVYMRNGRIRGFKVPSLVRNGYTSSARSNLTGFSQAWNDLTDAQRLSWNNASGITRSNRFGQPVEVKGKALFVMCNVNLANLNGGPVSTFVPDALVPLISSLVGAGSFVGTTMTATFTPTPSGAGTGVLIFATSPQKVGVYRPSQSKYRLIGFDDGISGATSPINIQTMYLAKFGQPTAGQRVFIRLVGVSTLSGLASAPADANFIEAS